MEVIRSGFGLYQGKVIDLFTLKNNNGVVINITNYGATVTSIRVPDSNGIIEEITCGFDTFKHYFSRAYVTNATYFGSTVGRYASQIKNATFTLEGIRYDLAKNCGENNLHGGKIGFDKKVWHAEAVKTDEASGVIMNLLSEDMEEGFPGNVAITVSFLLNDNNEFCIHYKAETDKTTPFSVTNHTYFNLSGFKSSVEHHTVIIAAGKKLAMDETGAALGTVVPLEGENDDLRVVKSIKEVHEQMDDGFEHYYIFDKEDFDLEKVAEFRCRESGRTLEVTTSEPGMLFYTGKYISDALKRKRRTPFGKYGGFCCETHRYPNGPNISDSPESILKAGETFNSTTIFTFGW
ncbi:MAG: aldose epimerase family protein [Bacteroidota bacterium]